MDNMFLLRGNMQEEELRKYGDSQIQKEVNMQEYLHNQEQNLQMDGTQLFEKMQTPQKQVRNVVPDMPVEKKESKRKKKHQAQLKSQIKRLKDSYGTEVKRTQDSEVQMRLSQLKNEDIEGIISRSMKPEKLSPRYVLENYAQVRHELDIWRAYLKFFGEGGQGQTMLNREQAIRVEMMQNLYMQSERAFISALKALGYHYIEQADGVGRLEGNVTPEQMEQALNENIKHRGELIEQEKTLDERVADLLIEESQERIRPDVDQMHRDMAANPKYSFIQSDYMCHEYQYDAVKEIKELLESNPRTYQLCKGELDRLYGEMFHLMEVNGIYQFPSMVINDIIFDKDKVASKKMERILAQRQEVQNRKMQLIRDRAECIKAGVKNILFKTELTRYEELVLREYMHPTTAQEHERLDIEAEAGTYAGIYNEKKAILESLAENMFGEKEANELLAGDNTRFMMLMESEQQEHNESVLVLVKTLKNAEALKREGGDFVKQADLMMGEAVKPIVLPYLQKMRDFDIHRFENASDEELIAHMEELQQLYISGMFAADLAKKIDPDDPEGRSIKDAFNEDDKDLFVMKCSIVQSYAVKARTLAMIKAYSMGALSEPCFIGEELRRIRIKCGLGDDAPVGMSQMLALAKEKLTQAMLSEKVARQKFVAERERSYKEYCEQTEVQSKEMLHQRRKTRSTIDSFKTKLTDLVKAYSESGKGTDSEEFSRFWQQLKSYTSTFFEDSADNNIGFDERLHCLEAIIAAGEAYNKASLTNGENMDPAQKEFVQDVIARVAQHIPNVQSLNEVHQQRMQKENEFETQKEHIESALWIDKFRKLGEDAANILQEDEGAQVSFLSRAVDLQKYVNKYKDVTSHTMTQFREWLNLVQQKAQTLVVGWYNKFAQTADNSYLLENLDLLRGELVSNDPERFYNAVLEMRKMEMSMELAYIPLDEIYELQSSNKFQEASNLVGQLAQDNMEQFSVEFWQRFVEIYYEKYERLSRMFEEHVLRFMESIPEEVSERELVATYLVAQTELGKELAATSALSKLYINMNNICMPLVARYQEEHPEIVKYTKSIDDKNEKIGPYAKIYGDMGVASIFAQGYLSSFKRIFVEGQN